MKRPTGKTRVAKHWGEWLKARAAFLGFKSNSQLAAAIGCSRQVLLVWMQMACAPESMRRKLDAALCRELKTDRFTLFTNFVEVSPESAPLVNPPTEPADNREILKRQMQAAIELLDGPSLEKLRSMARPLLHECTAA